jgi:hypothetical protein
MVPISLPQVGQRHPICTTSTRFSTPAGIPQGSPLSPILYIFYNADLLDIRIPHALTPHLSLGFIDDIGYGVKSVTTGRNVEKLKEILAEAEQWRKRHGVQFEKSKYILIHFTRNHRDHTGAALMIDGTTITPTKEAKYLGVVFDQRLKYRAHMNLTVKKGTQFGLAIGGIARATWGALFKYLRRLFTSVTTPKMDYAVAIWHRPKDQSAPTNQQLNKLSTVQRQVTKAITGCFRTTPTAALEYETALLPPSLRLQEKVLKTVTRMLTFPPQHPLHEWICKAREYRCGLSHLSNLENIARYFPECMYQLETILPYIKPPWWSLKADIRIDKDKDTAETHHLQTIPNLNPLTTLIYTDGSEINGGIGAAMYCYTSQQVEKRYLGKESESMVYAGELEVIHMAIIHANKLQEADNDTTGCLIC